MESQQENPWKLAWFHPKRAIQAVVEKNPKKGFFWLASLYALQYTLFNIGFSMKSPAVTLLVIAIIIAPVLGILWFYAFGWLLHLSGKWLKGGATQENLRASIAWSKVPVLINYVLWLVLVIANGSLFFDYSPFLSFCNVLMILISLWTFVLLVGMVAQVQGFSIGRALGNCLLATLIFFVFVFFISLILTLMNLI
jgi:hypothetical protein